MTRARLHDDMPHEERVTGHARSGCAHPFEVIFVCTANRARSALAEAFFRRDASGLDVVARSVGVDAGESVPALGGAVEAARRRGVDLSAHRSRRLEPDGLAAADLVLGFQPSHVAAAVVEGGAEPARTFLIGEVPGLLVLDEYHADPCAHARWMVARADSRRVRTRPSPEARLIGDPFGKSQKVMNRTADEIEGLVGQIIRLLFDRQLPVVHERPGRFRSSIARRFGAPRRLR